MSDFKVSLNKIPTKIQFNSKELEELDKLTANNAVTINADNIKAFADMVGNKGCSFCPATFKDDVKSKSSFDQSQLLPLYFDNRDTSFEKVKAKADSCDMPILFAYDTFSTGNRNKFSVVFLNDVSVPELRDAEATQKALMTIFPEADKSSSDVTKLYHGGNKLLYFDDTAREINIDSLFMNMALYLRKRYGATNYKRKVAEFAEETGVRLNERKLPDISVMDVSAEECINYNDGTDDKKSTISTMKVFENVGNLSKRIYRINYKDQDTEPPAEPKKPIINRPYRSGDLQSLNSHCRLYQEFQSGIRILSQLELLGLASNLIQVQTGDKKFKSILSANSYFGGQSEKYDNWDYYFYYIKDRDASSCVSFCPRHSNCPHGKNILSTVKPHYHQMERIANYIEHLVTLDEAAEDFNRKFRRAVNSKMKGWHIIKSQTAIGKTQAILELLRDTSEKVLIVVPTNALKREIYERAAAMGIELTVSPSLHELKDDMPDYVWDEIESLLKSGRSVMPYMKKAITENHECAGLFKRYMKELDEFNNTDGHAITTHRRFLTMEIKTYDLVIIDEDIIFNTIIPNKTKITVFNLEKLLKRLKKTAANIKLAAKIRSILKHINEGTELFSLKKIPYTKAHEAIPMAVDIASLCAAVDFCCHEEINEDSGLSEDCVSFINPVKFSDNVNYIMVSATVDETICELYFGAENMEFSECLNAGYTGTLNQYHDSPKSRTDMKKDHGVIGRIQKWSGNEQGISFKMFKKHLDEHYSDYLTYGSCSGRDHMKGKDIDVIGTPHQPEWIYKLFAYSLGLDFDTDEKIRNQKAIHNGWRFWFATFENEYLRAIQFYMIESETEQAVGRARLLREPCTVNLFSNFPLRQAVMMESEYDKEEVVNAAHSS